MNKGIKAVIFDLDGTLADTGDMCIKNVYETFDLYSVKPELLNILETFGSSEQGTFSKFVPEHADEAFEKYLEITRKNHYLCNKCFGGIYDILNFLRGRVKIGLITGKSAEAAKITLSVLGIDDVFDCMMCGEPLNFKKPSDMKEMCRIFHIQPDEAVYIGDMKTDVSSANEAGLISAAACWAKDTDISALEKENPDLIFNTPYELFDFLKENTVSLVRSVELAMIKYFEGDTKRISHFIKVHDFARLIALGEGMGARDREIVEVCAYVHDIGIKKGEELYGRNDAKIQEQLGGNEARHLLSSITQDSELIDRVVEIVEHHHTSHFDGEDHRTILEADFIVNAQEENLPKSAILTAREKIFRHKTAIKLLNMYFGL